MKNIMDTSIITKAEDAIITELKKLKTPILGSDACVLAQQKTGEPVRIGWFEKSERIKTVRIGRAAAFILEDSIAQSEGIVYTEDMFRDVSKGKEQVSEEEFEEIVSVNEELVGRVSFEKVTNYLGKLLYELNKTILNQAEMIWYEVASLLSGQGIIVIGSPGTGKSDTISKLCLLSGLKYFKFQFNRDTLVAELTGGVVIEKTQLNGKERIKFDYLMENILNCDVFQGDEVQEAGSGVMQALRTVFEEREWQGSKIPLRAYFLTQNPSSRKEMKDADYDRTVGIYEVTSNVTREKTDVLKDIIHMTAIGQKDVSIEPIMERDDMLASMEWCKKVQIPSGIQDLILHVGMAYSKGAKNREVTERFFKQAVKLVKANAIMSGYLVARDEDVKILKIMGSKYGLDYALCDNIVMSLVKNNSTKASAIPEKKVADYLTGVIASKGTKETS